MNNFIVNLLKQVKPGFTNYLPRGLNFLKKKNLEKIQKKYKKLNIFENFGFFFQNLEKQVKFASKIYK